MTATVSKNNAEYSVDFHLNVIHESDCNVSDITDNSVADIKAMNPDGEVSVSYSEDGTQITSIEGKYSDIIVENADDALDVIQSVHSVVGIEDPYEELDILVNNSDEYGAEYTFEQTYNDYLVYGRRITVSVDESGITDSLSSGVFFSEGLSDVNNTPQITSERAEEIAAEYYGGECEADSTATALAYYTLEEYSDDPVLTYMVNVSGDNAEGDYVDETIFIDVADCSVVKTYTNIIAASSTTGSGKNELDQKVSFPVSFSWTDWYFYYMQDLDRNIQMYNQRLFLNFRIGSELNWWTDDTAISAYTNMIKTYDWYKSELDRDSVDGNGFALKVIVHNDKLSDNAFWDSAECTLNFCDNSLGSALTTTTAAALDFVVHEYTHGVVQFVTGGLPYSNATGAIDEGYADIFGCLVDGDWQIFEDWSVQRDASDPTKYSAPDKMSSPFYVDYTTDTSDNGGVHTNSSLVYHAAYLMTEYGMSEDTLAKLWYKSLGMGYDATSTFQTVRINVLKAARKIKLSDIEIERIKKAFDEVEIYETQNDLGNVPEEAVEYNGHYYYVYDIDTITDWNMAQEYCEEQGGYLATITSQEENDFVYAYLEEYDYESAYFGFTDQEEEGNWKWVNGEISSYTNWHSGEPNSENTNEDFAMYYYKFSDGTWNDGDFGNRTANGGRAFICEWGE